MNNLEEQKLCITLIIKLPNAGLHSELVQYCSYIFTTRASEICFTLGRFAETDGEHNHILVKHVVKLG